MYVVTFRVFIAINKEVNEEMTQQCKNKTTKNFQGKQQTIQNNSDSDSEYDMLFDKMPVISNKEDRSIEKKAKEKQILQG